MKRYLTIVLAIFVVSLSLTACERENRVKAAGEGDSDTYQPRPAPDPGLRPGDLIVGDISKVDIGNKMMVVRLNNGMDQTMRLADDTQVITTFDDPNGVKIDLKQLSTLIGSAVKIQWKDTDGSKLATSIDVTERAPKRHKRRH